MGNSRISSTQEDYLRQLKRKKDRIKVIQISIFLLFLGIWEIAVRCSWIDGFIFSSSSRILHTFQCMCADHSIFLHVGITLAETLVSFLLVVIFGMGIAILLWYK